VDDLTKSTTVVEHAVRMAGGGYHIRSDGQDIERIYPTEEWIEHQIRSGAMVYKRRVIVVEDWTEVR
jgi:hypothetical protein